MKTLVTGGAGFIGSNLVDALIERGDEVVVVDDISTGRRENLERAVQNGAELAELDIRDARAVSDAVGRAQPDAIFHLAAQIDVRKSVADPAHDAGINVGGTVNVLRAAQTHEVARIVNTSTGGAIYGEGQVLPAPEDHPVAPEAPYGLSKFCAEQYCELFRRLHGLNTLSLRYGNVFGPRQDPLGEAGVIAIFCGALLEDRTPRSSATASRPAITSMWATWWRPTCAPPKPRRTAPSTSGAALQTSVLEIVSVLARHSDNGFQAAHAPARPGEVQHIYLDTSRAREELGWEARVDLDEGLELTLASLR